MADLTGLGRIHIPDNRRMAYPMAAPEPIRAYRNHLLHGPVNDQGATPHCVAHSFEHLLRFLPIVNARKAGFEIDKLALYNAAQALDPWEGSAYDGTTVDAGAKALRAMGYISGWTWAFDAETVAAHVLEIGPVVVGTTWTMGMFAPDRDGYLHPDGPSVGGHAYTIKGAHLDKGCFYLTNSWGPEWCNGGHAKISFADMDALLRDNGEACAPIEIDVEG